MCERAPGLIFVEIRTGNFTPQDHVTLRVDLLCMKGYYSLYLYSNVLDISFRYFETPFCNNVWKDAKKTWIKSHFILPPLEKITYLPSLLCQHNIWLPSAGYTPPAWTHYLQIGLGWEYSRVDLLQWIVTTCAWNLILILLERGLWILSAIDVKTSMLHF